VHLLDEVKAAGARFKALDDPWCDTTTPQGELILTVMGGLAEFERKLIRQRCYEGIKSRPRAQSSVAGECSTIANARKLPSVTPTARPWLRLR
jgi:DNA invertase Pin-like site-specific DNA recombinase